MKYCTASVLLEKLKTFQETLKFIDIDKANIKRDGAYTEALTQLELVLDNQLDLEVITHPDNTLRNIMMLAHLDSTDAETRKKLNK